MKFGRIKVKIIQVK